MELNETQRALLDKHLALVIEANKKTNLTRIDTFEQGRLLHIEDSLAGIVEVDAAPAGPFADLGSGAGFPGIPLAVATGRSAVLVESVKKKADLLASFATELGLSDHMEIYAGRAEALAKERAAAFAVVTARALSSLPSLMELASPLLVQGGRLVCYKSSDIEAELLAADALQEKLAMHMLACRRFMLSDGVTPRSIVVFEKRGEPTVPLPRREGQAQKHPYKA